MKFKMNVLYLICLITIYPVLTSAQDSMYPGWFLEIPPDTDEFLYATASGETLRDAVMKAYSMMASKHQTQMLADKSNSQQIISMKVNGIKISSLIKTVESDSLLEYSNAIEMIYENEKKFFKANLFEKESSLVEKQAEDDHLNYEYQSSYNINGYTIKDIIDISNHFEAELIYESRWTNEGYLYFVLFKYPFDSTK